MSRPRILLSNDDGVNAPGLTALAKVLQAQDFCTFSVSGPSGERSAQSHCISVGKTLHAFEIDVGGAEEAWAVDGTPADSVMIAIWGPLLQNPKFDLVVSGINRGDNCGLHVIYSGTVGAAREAACKDLPALAFSLDNYGARSEEQYATAARYCVALIKAVLGVLPGAVPAPLRTFAGYVINANVPGGQQDGVRGYYLARQGQHCHFPNWQELEVDPVARAEGQQDGHLHMGAVTLRAFKNSAGSLRGDQTEGTDSWAVRNGWVAVTPVGLLSDIPLSQEAALSKSRPELVAALASVVQAAAKDVGGLAGGIPHPAANGSEQEQAQQRA